MNKNKYKNYNIFSSNAYMDIAQKTYKKYKFLKPWNLKILNYLKQGANVLDYGAGFGNLLVKLNWHNKDLNYYACDICDFMPEDRKKSFNFKLIENENSLPYPDNFFDLVISQNVLEHMINPNVMFSESSRILKKKWLYTV